MRENYHICRLNECLFFLYKECLFHCFPYITRLLLLETKKFVITILKNYFFLLSRLINFIKHLMQNYEEEYETRTIIETPFRLYS